MMLWSGHRIQPRFLLALSLVSCGVLAILCLNLGSVGSDPALEDPSAAAGLRVICVAGALLCFFSVAALLYLRSYLHGRTSRLHQLSRLNALLTAQQEHAPDDLMVVAADGTVIFHNRRYAELWGEPDGASGPLPFLKALEPLLSQVRDRDPFLEKTKSIADDCGAEVDDRFYLSDGRVFDRHSAPLRAPNARCCGRVWYLHDSTALSRALAALNENESTFRGVLENSADGMVVIDETHQIVMVNEQFELMFGYRRSEVLGKAVDILVPRRFTSHTQYVTEFFASPRRRMMGHGLKLVALRKDGSEFPVEIGLSPLRTARGFVVSAAIRDVTQHELADKKVAAAAAYARTLLEASPDPLLTISIEGEIRDVNEAMVALTGRTREALLESSFAEHFTDPEKAREVRRQVFESGFVRDYPLSLRALSGKVTEVLYNAVVYRDEGGKVAGAFASARDMTQRQVIEAELRELSRVLEQRVAQRSENLLAQAREVVEAAGVVAASSRSIREMTEKAVRSAIDTSAALSHTTAAIEQVRQTALNSSQNARHVSLAAQRSAEVAQGGRTAVQETISGMAAIQLQVSGSAESIIRLSEQSRTIGDIIATVNDLAEQSNLLAVNAAIEASKAGEQGKGFGVVAREVKNLSEQSKVATAQVRSILEDIRRATDGAVLASEQGMNSAAQGVEQARKVGEAIGHLEDGIERSAHAALQIAASCQQQLIGLDQVAQAMESINEASGHNVEGMKRLEGALKHLEDLGERLKLLSAALQM